MRPWLLVLPVALLCALPPGARAQAGGTAAPDTEAGGAEYGTPARKTPAAKSPRPLVATQFTVAPHVLQPGGAPARIAYRIDGPARKVRVRIEIVAAAGGAAVKRIRLGWKPTGVRRVTRWTLAEGDLPPGRYVARLHATDGLGHALRRTASASGRSSVSVASPPAAPVVVGDGVFPVRGSYTFGSDEARFGADRGSHRHQGQDIMAAEGIPVVAPRAGYVRWKAYQADGAGHYLVVRGKDGRDYVFMHLRAGSATVAQDDAVTAGQIIGEVGNTGRSQGAHLHFEIWPDGWYVKGSEPIDPRPELDAWAGSPSQGQ